MSPNDALMTCTHRSATLRSPYIVTHGDIAVQSARYRTGQKHEPKLTGKASETLSAGKIKAITPGTLTS